VGGGEGRKSGKGGGVRGEGGEGRRVGGGGIKKLIPLSTINLLVPIPGKTLLLETNEAN
jgi:hypothetical protein